jgi:non-ribosomal peptide synthase protein (TIGR01720 family)
MEAGARSVVVSLSAEETSLLLRQVPEAYQTRIDDILLTALAKAFEGWTGARSLLVDVEGHGREEIFEDLDLTRTVGWFTAIYPLALELPASGGEGAAIKAIKEQVRAVPNRGLGYGLLRYLRDDAIGDALRALPQAEVSFNYLGQLDQALPSSSPLGGARESAGPTRSPRGRRRHAIDVLANVVGGRLHARFAYAGTQHDRETIERLAERFAAALRAIIAHCVSPNVGGPTPSDLLEPGLTQEMIDFMATLDPGAADDD